MLLSTFLRYSARKVKTNLPPSQQSKASKYKKTQFTQQQLLQIAGHKPNPRSPIRMFKQKLQDKNQKQKTSKIDQQQQKLDDFNNQEQKGSVYEKNMKSSKQKYSKFKHPQDNADERADIKVMSLKQLSKIRLQPQYLPMSFLSRVKKVFHKYSQQQLREIALHFASYSKLRYSQQKLDYEKYSDLGFNKLQQKLPDKMQAQQPIYLIGRDKIYQPHPRESDPIRKLDDQPIKPDITYTQNIVISYLLLRAPKTFSVAVRMMTEIKYKFNQFKPKTFIDFGAGLGAGGLAFLDIFRTQGLEVYAVQPAPKMRKMSQYLNQDKMQSFTSLGQLSVKVRSADIVYAGYVLNQLAPQLVEVYLESLWIKVKSQGFLVLVEHGNPFGSRIIHEARKWILKKQEALIAAPCPHHIKCPLAKSSEWCHFDQQSGMYPRQIFGKLPNDNQIKNQKFSYLILQKKFQPQTPQPQSTQKIQPNITHDWDRIIYPLIKGGGHFVMNICTKTGNFQRRIVAKSHGEQYKEGRKLRWGDLWRFAKRIPNKFRKERSTGKRLW